MKNRKRTWILALSMALWLVATPLSAQPNLPQLAPNMPYLYASSLQEYFPDFNQIVGIDLDVVLQAMLARDQQPQNHWAERLSRGWGASFKDDWAEAYFAEVFQVWFYLSWWQKHQPQALDQEQQQHLAAIQTQMLAILAVNRVQVSQTSPMPLYSPSTALKNDYSVSLAELADAQPLNPKRSYEYLYRASASEATPQLHEQWAIDTLLEKPGSQLAATRVWKYFSKALKQGLSEAQAFEQSARLVEQHLQQDIQSGEFLTEQLAVINWDTGFRPEDVLFLSGDYATTALYGSVIFIIKQQQPRGIPLNEYGTKTGFYQRLPYQWLLSPKGFWIYAVADKAEYVLPAYVAHSELVGVDVRDERTFLVKEAKRTGQPGILLRKYRKQYDSQAKQLLIHIIDPQNRWMGSFSEQPLPTYFQPPAEPSAVLLPLAVRQYLTNQGYLSTP